MSMKTKLSAAAFVTLAAISAVASPASAAPRICDDAVSLRACGDHVAYVQALRSRQASTIAMKNVDTRDNAVLSAGGGGGGGGGGGR